MSVIRELRLKLQEPRKYCDTFYGRYVMRRLSIYLTLFFSRLKLTPSQITFFSILFGAVGIAFFFLRKPVEGILCVNIWYLLDHVDGEMARLRNEQTLTGLFFDTMANPILFPAIFFSMGASVNQALPNLWLFAGAAAGYGSFMLMTISFCESSVVLDSWQKVQGWPPKPAPINEPITSDKALPKKIFTSLHTISTFPVFLPIATLGIIGSAVMGGFFQEYFIKALITYYALTQNVLWVIILMHKVKTKSIDKRYLP